MAFLCVLSFLTYYDRQCIVRAQEDIQASLKISDSQMGLVFGAFWFAYALFEIPGGWLGDRFGARLSLTRIVLAWSLFTALTGLATGFYSLMTYRILFGMGEAGAYPNMARIQSKWLPLQARARAGGLLWLTARWGAAFAPIIFGSITRAFDTPSFRATVDDIPVLNVLATLASWRLGFIVSGFVGIVWCVVFYRWFRDDPSQKPTVNTTELQLIQAGRSPSDESHHMQRQMWSRLFRSPGLWGIGVYYICGGFGWSFFVSWMPRFLKDAHGITFQKSEWMSVLPLLCGGASCLIGGLLSDALVKRTGWRRFGRAIFPIVGCGTAAATMIAIPYVQTSRQATILMCITAAAFDFGQAATWASLVDIGGRYAGCATGFINMVGNLGASSQPYIGARVFNAYGWKSLFAIYAFAFVMAMSMWLIINPKKKFYEHHDDVPA
jgi:ACS family glucarate transporter-like MFS transporter